MSKYLDRPDSAISADSLEVPLSTLDKYPKQVHIPADTAQQKAKPKDTKNFLILNRKPRKSKTYLEKFREKLCKSKEEENIDSKSVEAIFGDSEIDSVADDMDTEEFLETEAFNEMVYHVLMNGGNFGDSSIEDDVKTEPPTMTSRVSYTHTSSASAVTTTRTTGTDVTGMDSASTRRPARGRNIDYQTNHKAKESGSRSAARESICKNYGDRRSGGGSGTGDMSVCTLGGLGPDMETLRPRLDRARSVQRYSEQVRLDNKIRITRHKSLSNTRTANAETDKTIAENKQRILKEKSAKISDRADKRKLVKKTREDVKSEGAGKEKLGKNERKIKIDSPRGDNNGNDRHLRQNIDWSSQLDSSMVLTLATRSLRICDVYKSQVLRALEERHMRYRDAVSDLYRDRERAERPRAAAATRRRLP